MNKAITIEKVFDTYETTCYILHTSNNKVSLNKFK